MSLDDVHALLLQAPLSQVNSVLADLRGLVQSGGSSSRLAREFEDSLPLALRQLHEDQGKVVRLPGLEAGSLLNEAARPPVPRDDEPDAAPYRDEAQHKVFSYDHAADKVTSSESYRAALTDDLRGELERHLGIYLRDHYPDLDPQRTNEGACASVMTIPPKRISRHGGREHAERNTKVEQGGLQDEETEQTPQETAMLEKKTEDPCPEDKAQADKAVRVDNDDEVDDDEGELVETVSDGDGISPPSYIITIVSGKSNPKNFWSGRILSTYHCRSDAIVALTKLQIHYYENGNVQLNAEVPANISLSSPTTASTPAAQAKMIISAISKHERHVQETQLEKEVYEGLNERAFKGLRRQLPVTRQKVDWDKVTNYRLGQDLAEHNEAA